MKVIYLTWNEFTDIAEQNKKQKDQYKNIIYRGHSSSSYELSTTLARYLSHERFSASEYHKILHEIRSHRLYEFELPSNTPFVIGPLAADEEHAEAFNQTFLAMIRLRHLGFPSPLLDWTEDASVAAFFAFATVNVKEAAIYCLKEKALSVAQFDSTKPYLHTFKCNDDKRPERDKRQKSIYTLSTEINWNPDNRTSFCLSRIEEFINKNNNSSKLEIEKYIILDARKQQNNILRELFNKGLDFKYLYVETDKEENTGLKDIAIKKFLLHDLDKTETYNSALASTEAL